MYLLLLLSRFSHVWLCATPQTAAHQAPPSLGFSRQEHWSGLPFPSPMLENEKWKWSRSVMSNQPFATPWIAAYQAPLSMGFSKQEYWSGVPLPSPSHVLTHTQTQTHTHTYISLWFTVTTLRTFRSAWKKITVSKQKLWEIFFRLKKKSLRACSASDKAGLILFNDMIHLIPVYMRKIGAQQ